MKRLLFILILPSIGYSQSAFTGVGGEAIGTGESASVATISNSVGPIPPTVNNTVNIDAFINNMLAYSVEKDVKMPIWLPSGTYSVTIYNHAYQTYNHSFNYSGVLFNIVP
jgi:hypothetical protein